MVVIKKYDNPFADGTEWDDERYLLTHPYSYRDQQGVRSGVFGYTLENK